MSDINLKIGDEGDINLTVGDSGDINLTITGSGINEFLELTDVDPTTFSGQANKVVSVNSGETALEFTTSGSGDVVGPGSAVNENLTVFDSTTGKLIKDSGTNLSAVTANTAKNTNVSTNLSEGTSTETTVDVNSSDGTNATLVSASVTRAGLLTKAKFDEIVLNNAKVTNVSTNLSAGTLTATTIDVNSSDGTDATLVEADTTNAGILGSDKWDEIVANTLAKHAESHTILSHSDTTATGAELDTLTGGGDTTLHDHDGISENTTHRSSDGTNHGNVGLNDTHRADNTQAHSDYLLNSAADIGVGLSLTGDNVSADTTYVPNVLYNTDATPPTASTVPIGTIYVQYTV